ncbi:MAG: DNA primase [Arcobacteraceae bacterium]|nr:DNA primase [Arcobacteraceae bacterium]
MITKNSIENLKNNLDIVDIISQYLQIKKSGANFKACCPFHGEKTPSFVISPAKQIYHCFGCGVGGDSIKFVMEYEKLSYPEALEKLASMVNFSLEYDDNYKKQDYSSIEKLNEYYQKLLTHNNVAHQYLLDRGISSFSIEKFEIGYAPTSQDTINFLKSNFLSLTDAQDFGLIDTGQNGLYARFIERITFPIYTLNSKIIGFGGRTITGHNAKYINSPQTKHFNKSRLLYGYNLAKENVYKHKEIIITEGYLDVIMLHQAGFDNSVATLGTALTAEHLPILNRGEPRVIVAYDGDKAGLNAAFKASTLLSHNSFEGGVVIFGEGYDPADMVKEGKIEELNSMFKNVKSFIEYAIDFLIESFDINIPSQKQKGLIEVNNYLKTLTPIMQQEYAPYVASALKINTNLVNVSQSTNNNFQKQVDLSQIDIGELSVIKTLLEKNELLELVLNTIDEDIFQTHKGEFQLFIEDKNNPMLRGLLIQDEVKIYDKDELYNQLLFMLIPHYTKKLQYLKNDKSIELKSKMRKIRELQDKIALLKRGKL